MLKVVEVGKVYRNKKNKFLYKVEGVGRYTEKPMELEYMVFYKSLYPTDESPYWIRPFELFCEKFEEFELD